MPDNSGRKLINFIVAAKGNLALAAERAGLSKEALVAAIVGEDHGQSLNEQLRAVLLISAFDITMQTQQAYLISMDELEPAEIAKAYSSQMSTLQNMLKTPTVELSDEAPYDSTLAKQRILSRLSRYKKLQVVEPETDGESESSGLNNAERAG